MLCIYFSLSVQCMLTLLLQLKQTPTDSSFSRKKTHQERRNNGTNQMAIQRNKGGDRCSYEVEFFSSGSLGVSLQHYNAVFLILVFVFHFLKYFYIIFFCILFKRKNSL